MTDPNYQYNNLLNKFKNLETKDPSYKGQQSRTKSPKKKGNYNNKKHNNNKNTDNTDNTNNSNNSNNNKSNNRDIEQANGGYQTPVTDEDTTNTNNDTTVNNDNDNNNNHETNNDSNNNDNDNTANNSGNDDSNDKSTIEETKTSTEDVNKPSEINTNITNNDTMANEHNGGQDSTVVHESLPIEKWLQNNKLYNSELLVVLKANHVDNEDDLKSFFEEADDIASVIKSVRKRTEKVLGGFTKKVVGLTGLDYEYKAPRHRAKASNVSNGSQNRMRGDSYLNTNNGGNGSGSGSGSGGGRPSSPRNRSYSNSSQGSSTSVGSYSYRKHKGRPVPTEKEISVNANAHNAKPLKNWLQGRSIFHKELFDHLASRGFETPDDLEVLSVKEFDRLVREVRVDTFKQVNDSKKRNRVDKLLVKFEKEWRKLSGIRKTNMTKEQQEQWGLSPRTASQRRVDDKGSDNDSFFS